MSFYSAILVPPISIMFVIIFSSLPLFFVSFPSSFSAFFDFNGAFYMIPLCLLF